MIALVVWHALHGATSREVHERALVSFGETLALKDNAHYRYTANFRSQPVPWFKDAGEVYESWYVMNHSSALSDMLAAIDHGMCHEAHLELTRSHEQIITGSSSEAAGLYRHRAGGLEVSEARYLYWLEKDKLIRVHEFIEELIPHIENEASSLWSRIAGLSAGGHFCLFGAKKINLPANFFPIEIALDRI